MPSSHHASIPAWAWAVPLLASALLALRFAHIPSDDPYVLVLAGLFLDATVFAAVHHAEVLALKLGEPFGSILLAVAVTVIEAGLIVSIMLAGAEGSERVARDSVFAAVMIVLNGVVGLCLILGAGKHFEQTFSTAGRGLRARGARDFGHAGADPAQLRRGCFGPPYSILQLEGVGLMSLVLWCVFVFVQTVKHRDYFLDAPSDDNSGEELHNAPGILLTLLSLCLLVVSLAAVVLLAKTLSYPVDAAIGAAGLPKAFVGVVIALIVLMPEGLAAIKSALRNRLQNSINLTLGSAIASIGLTIPVVAVVSIVLSRQIALGVSPTDMTLLILTLYIAGLTLGPGARPCCRAPCIL